MILTVIGLFLAWRVWEIIIPREEYKEFGSEYTNDFWPL